MKMVKSLLLGSAAGLVAVTAGQAADLPVKAKPVEYVKICSLYGAGFYYMPGTDLCLKVGGWVRFEATEGANGSLTWGPYNGNANTRATSNFVMRARAYVTVDAREQTAYGTARGYFAVGISTNDVGLNTAANQLSANRAFVQFAGITGGITQSFYDYFSAAASSYRGGYYPSSDTGDPGWLVFGYTAQLGNGLSATLAAEQRRTTQIINAGNGGTVLAGGTFANSATAGTLNGFYTSAVAGAQSVIPGAGAYGGLQTPDIVGNLRLDQAWGGAQLMGALHDVNANYYSSGVPASGHPSDQWGFAVGGGLRLNFPSIAQGDYFQTQVNYTQGALRYLFFTPNSDWVKANGNNEAYGVLSDAVYGLNGSSMDLTTAWGVNASYEHYWTPQWHESFFGGYYAVSYDSTANTNLCLAETGTAFTAVSVAAGAPGACNNNWSVWYAGSRLQWDVTKTFYLGVEALYDNLQSATPFGGNGGAIGTPLQVVAGQTLHQESSSDNWAITFRAHKDFLP
jgi:Porin subfamily